MGHMLFIMIGDTFSVGLSERRIRSRSRCLELYLRNQRGGMGESEFVDDGDSALSGEGFDRLLGDRCVFFCLFLCVCLVGVSVTGSGVGI